MTGLSRKRACSHRINSDLANDLGNLGQRVLSMIAKNCEGKAPQPGAFTPEDEALISAAKGALLAMRDAMETQAIHKMLEAIWKVVGDANRYVDQQAPWALKKTDPERMATVLYVLADVIRILGIYVQSTVPDSAANLLDQLSVPADARRFADVETALIPGTELPKPSPVFPRYVEAEEA